MHFSPNWHLGKNGQSSFGWKYGHSSSELLQFGQCLHFTFFLSSASWSPLPNSFYCCFSLILFLWVLKSITVFPSLLSLTSSRAGCWWTFFTLLLRSPFSLLSFLIKVPRSTSIFEAILYSMVLFFWSLSKTSPFYWWLSCYYSESLSSLMIFLGMTSCYCCCCFYAVEFVASSHAFIMSFPAALFAPYAFTKAPPF